MKPEQFCYWLQGFAELTGDSPTPEQWKAIKDHLQTVFTKVTPEYEFRSSGASVWQAPHFNPLETQMIC